MVITADQESTLRHMLGIDLPQVKDPHAYRDYYCANPGDAEMAALEQLGMVAKYAVQGGYEWFCTTVEGRKVAFASHKKILQPKSKRVYSKYLSVSDVCTDLTFKQFLTSPEFAESRVNA